LVTVKRTIVPRLGDAADRFADALGQPYFEAVTHLGIVRRYIARGTALTVVFVASGAVAVHCPYTVRSSRRLWDRVTPDAFVPAGQQRRLLCADGGWVVATPDCPYAVVRLVAGMR
jgi:hypothetical protein